MSHLAHRQIHNLLNQNSLHIPELYHLSSNNYRSGAEELDDYQADIQQRLWEINSEKSHIELLFTSLDQRWHKLDRESLELQEIYSQIQIATEAPNY